MFTIKINNKEYNIRDSINLKEEYNETLDSAIVILDTSDEELDIQPYDDFYILENGNQSFKFEVDNFIYNEVGYSPFVKREYQINLFSETKALEKITLPDLSITQSMIREQHKSVYDYIFQYCATYIPKIKVQQNNTWDYEPKYLIDEEVKKRFEVIECPEFSWNAPTLREVLNDLMMVDDCLCVVRNNVITFFDITQKGNEIDQTKISHKQKTMSSGDYNSDLTITMKNSIGQSLVRTTEYKSLRNNNSGEITTDNALFLTQHPIYNLRKVTLSGYVFQPLEKTLHYVDIDITDYIKEKEAYETLSKRTVAFGRGGVKNTHQMYNLYFERGQNKIEGFGENYYFVGLGTQAKIHWIMHARLSEMGSSLYSFEPNESATDIRDLMLNVEYDAIVERKMQVGRYLPLKNEELKSFDNQSSSYVDVQQQALFEYSKINRLSNDILIIHGIYNSLDEIPQLSDTIGDYILFSRELNIFDNYIVFKGTLTRDYILRNYFTGVQAKRRSWQIASGKDALTRYDVTKYYLEFSKTRKIEYMPNLLINNEVFINNLIGGGNVSLNNCVVYTMDEEGNRYPPLEEIESVNYNGEGYELDLGVEIQGKSLCLNIGFNDNYAIDSYAYLDDKLYRNGLYRYANNHGEFTTMNLRFLNYLDPADNEFTWPEFGYSTSQIPEVTKLASKGRIKPLIKFVGNPIIDLTLNNYYKDNREIIKQTIQFEYCSDTRDIVIGDLFVKTQALLTDNRPELFIVTSDNDRYNLDSKSGLGGARTDLQLKITSNNNSTLIELVDINGLRPVENIVSWGIVNNFNELVLGMNGNEFYVYMNLLNSRDDNIYNDVITQVRIGKSDRLLYPNKEVFKPSIKLPHKEINVNTLIKPKF